MSSFRPSAPPIPGSSAAPSAPPGQPSSYDYNYPPPPQSQSYHVSHQSYSAPPPPPPPPSTSAPYAADPIYSYNPNPTYPPPAQSYHVGHQSFSHSTSQFGAEGCYGYNPFPPGTDPEIVRSFQMVDRDRSGFVEESELQQALSSAYHRFSLRTIRLLMFLFKNPNQSSLKLGPTEFAAVWKCLGEWRVIFERFDRERNGKIDAMELRDALYSLGYAIPPSVLQVLLSRYDNGSGRKVELNFDSFVECGMLVKGLTEKFKEKDTRYTGSATLSYDSFMSIVLPFLVTYD